MITPIHASVAKKSRKVHRRAVGALFFLQGICFATWASRIPTIQQSLRLSEAELGAVLLALPVGSMVCLPFAGWLVARIGSRQVATVSTFLYGTTLITLGLADSIFALLNYLFIFGFAGNLMNISVNTQAVGVEALYKKQILGSLHGMWSLAGFAGAAIGAFMVGEGVVPFYHFIMVAVFIVGAAFICTGYTLPADTDKKANQPIFAKPDKSLLLLGVIAFFSLICEGAMFDWSGVYFKKVVKADTAWVGAGYTAFMATMASGRFVADWFTGKFGVKRTLQFNGLLIFSGLLLAILVPGLITAVTGFLLVGAGVSSVVPLVYSAAGKSKVMSPGVALATVSSIGFLGFVIGPPLIGLVAGVTNLQISFFIVAVMGLGVTVLASKAKF